MSCYAPQLLCCVPLSVWLHCHTSWLILPNSSPDGASSVLCLPKQICTLFISLQQLQAYGCNTAHSCSSSWSASHSKQVAKTGVWVWKQFGDASFMDDKIGSTASIWKIRCNKKIVVPTLTRATLESKISLLRETRFKTEYALIKHMVENL